MENLAWYIVAFVFAGRILWNLWDFLPLVFILNLFSVSLSAIPVLLKTDWVNPIEAFTLTQDALTALIFVIAGLALFFCRLPWRQVMLWFCLLASIDSIYGGVNHAILTNTSLQGCFIAITAPFVWEVRWRGIFKIFPVLPMLAVWSTASTTAYLALGVIAAMTLFSWNWPWAIFTFFGVLGTGSLAHNRALVGINWDCRVGFWRTAFDWWGEHANRFFGAGLGSEHFRLDQLIHFSDGHVYQMHNQWLSILFNQGFFGLSSAVLLAAFALHQSRHDKPLFRALVALYLVAYAQFPLNGLFSGRAV